ncbi:MAG: hypothetical protein ACOH2H_15160 [Cypionkella sp.]
MNPDLIEAWEMLCRSALGRSLDDCPPSMVPAAQVAEAVFPIVMALGQPELASLPTSDETIEIAVAIGAKVIFGRDSVATLHIFDVKTRDTIREYAKLVLISTQLMAESDLEYGPVPDGLTGRDLGLAALSLEILGSKSPQRLLAQRRRQAH